MTQPNPIPVALRLTMLGDPGLPLSVHGHRPHVLAAIKQPKSCRGECKTNGGFRGEIEPPQPYTWTTDVVPAPNGTWMLVFVMHHGWCFIVENLIHLPVGVDESQEMPR